MSEAMGDVPLSATATSNFQDLHGVGLTQSGQVSKMSSLMEKMFVNSIPFYRRSEAANPIEWSWNLIQQINRTLPSESTKEFAIRTKVDGNTLLQIDSMTRLGAPRPTRWNPNWSWPVEISDEEPYELWVCRRLVEAAFGDPRISQFVAQLKPTQQQPDESTSLYQLRISNIRDINAFIDKIGGHLFSVPDPAAIDQYLCKEYKPSIQSKIARMVTDLMEDKKRQRPLAPSYTPTVEDYCAAALQAEEALVDFDNMIKERSGGGGAGQINLVTTAHNIGDTSNSILSLVRPVSLSAPSAPVAAGIVPSGEKEKASSKEAKTPVSSTEQALEKRLNKLSSTLDRLLKSTNKRYREDDSDEEKTPPRQRRGQVLLAMKGGRRDASAMPTCYNCKGADHKISNCPKPCRPEITCPRCKNKGHFVKDCPQNNAPAGMPRNGIAEVQENAGAA